jgi:HEAT repeat protein
MLGDEEAVIRAAAAEALGRISPATVPALIQVLQDPEKEVRQAAISALGGVGAEAAAAVPDLVALLPQDGPRGLHVVRPLGAIGPAAVPALIQALRGRDADVRSRAAQVLGLIGPEAQAAAPTLVEVLRDPEARVRVRAAEALWQIAQDPAGVALLPAVLGGEDGVLRRDAARCLGQMGPAARPAVPALVEALRDADDVTRVLVAEVLGRIGPGAAAAVPALAEALREPDDPISRTAAGALEQIGPVSVPALLGALHDQDSGVRVRAARALGAIDHRSPAAVAALTEAIRDPEAGVRVRAAEALWLIAEDPASIAILAEVLGNEEIAPGERRGAAQVLGQIGPAARAARHTLTKLTEAGNFLLRSAAADALRRVDPEAAREAGVWLR